MRERDMRLRVDRFLQARLRNMLMPATLGVGLALGGCASDGLSTDDGGQSLLKKDAVSKSDTSGSTVKYMAQVPDSGPNPIYSAAVPADAGPELPLSQPDYMAQMPDSGIGPVAVYSAPAPTDSGLAVRYMAQMPDAGAVAVYLAQIPPENS
jgi:hypothetical protein